MASKQELEFRAGECKTLTGFIEKVSDPADLLVIANLAKQSVAFLSRAVCCYRQPIDIYAIRTG